MSESSHRAAIPRSLIEAAVWAVIILVRDEVVEELSEFALVSGQGSVEEFVADSAHATLSERVGSGSTRWCGVGVGADGGEDVAEGLGVSAGSVADHEPDRPVVAHHQVPSALGSPSSGSLWRTAG